MPARYVCGTPYFATYDKPSTVEVYRRECRFAAALMEICLRAGPAMWFRLRSEGLTVRKTNKALRRAGYSIVREWLEPYWAVLPAFRFHFALNSGEAEDCAKAYAEAFTSITWDFECLKWGVRHEIETQDALRQLACPKLLEYTDYSLTGLPKVRIGWNTLEEWGVQIFKKPATLEAFRGYVREHEMREHEQKSTMETKGI